MKKTQFFHFFVIFLLLISASVYAQNITLLGSTTTKASGSGGGGVPPSLSWNIPAGSNRVMVVTYWFERDHRPTPFGDNYPSGNYGQDYIPPTVSGIAMTGTSNRYTYSRNDLTAATLTNAHFSTLMQRNILTDANGLPTGNATIAFPNINLPKDPGDELIVHIEVYANVSSATNYDLGGSSWGNDNSNANSFTYSSIPTQTQIGRSNSEVVYTAFAGITKDETFSITPAAWLSSTNTNVTNTGGSAFTAVNNEPDGIRSGTYYSTGNASAPSMTLTRPSSNAIFGVRLNFFALLPLAKPSVSGTVYKDTDGATNINGTGDNAGGLYVNAVGSDGKVVYSAAVASNGTFTIPAGYVTEGSTYTFQLSKNQGTIGATAPAKQLPTGWVTVGEATSATGNDGTADGTISLDIDATAVAGLRYGINDTSTPVTCTGGTANIPRSGTVTVNGVTINTSYTGLVGSYPSNYNSSCSSTIGLSANSLFVGGPGNILPNSTTKWSITLNFNKPVNDLIIVLGATGNLQSENFIFNSNGGAVSITAGTNCYSTISGNTIISGNGAPNTSGGGGGYFRISAPSAYTQLTINGDGGSDGSLMALCSLSITPAAVCNAGTTAPAVQNLSNVCPATTIDLTNAHTGTVPAGAALAWFTNNAHTGTALSGTQITQAGAGTYYAFYYDSVNACYSPASTPVTVTISVCPTLCSPTAFLSQDQTLYKIDTSTNPFTYTAIGTANVGGTGSPQAYNGTGYNSMDGYLYAVRGELPASNGGPAERYLIKIDPNTGQMVGVPRQIVNTNGNQIVTGPYVNGDFDTSGNYYIKTANNIGVYKVNVATAIAQSIPFNPSVNVSSSDIAYNINDGLFYGVSQLGSGENQLFKFDPANGNIVFIGTPFDNVGVFGAMIGANGKIYGATNGGEFYQFDLITGRPTLISGAPASINNDGANCPTNDLIFSADPYITKTDNTATYIAGTTTTYTIEAGNNGPFGMIGALVQDSVPAGIPAANMSYSVPVLTGGATTSITGIQTGALSDVVSLPVGATITYTVTVNIPAGFTGNLTNTATITSPPSVPDTNTANNTVTDTDTQALATLCSSEVFLSRTGAPSTTQLFGVNFSTGNPSGLNAVGGNAPYVYNGMAHNPKDGFIYAMDQNGPNLLKINPGTGVVTNLGTVPGLVSGLYAGEIDNNGIYYISGGSNRLYKIDLTVTPLAATSVLYSGGVSPGYLDLGYNVNDGFLYGISGSTLNRIDPANGNITTIGTATHPGTYGGMIGANGDIYGVLNAGGIHKFNITTGVHTVVTTISSGSGADAAHCVTSPLVFDANLSVTKNDGTLNYVPGSTTIYTIVVKNNGPFGLQDAKVSDLVPAGIPAANVSYTAVVSAGSSTNVTGTMTGAINDLVSLPKDGTVTYTVTVNIPVSFTGDLVNTVTVTPPINVNDTDMTNNTATDTDSGVCYRDPVTTGTTAGTKVGITLLKRAGTDNADNWPMVRKGGHIALESNTQGFVVTRIAKADLGNITAPQEGMMMYDTTDKCLKIYSDGLWKCFSTPACP
ncbi:DUF11 domain-containing protein [Chryseobacterium sp.]|uniref:beta strand repeat-containing protein n=1 Tax=Chryseobacterium sp. TaxID=1871047 RepID=UPI000EBEC6E7|nr:DUF11 domain-containing protein [Chryseobacterium sp.]HCM35929.1 hypothetical protein [Chryseobacterium sp.]